MIRTMTLSFLLLACSSNAPQSTDLPDYATNTSPTLPPTDNESGLAVEPECSKRDRVEIKLQSGEVLVLGVPRPCDPLWYLRDEGDPLP